MDHGQGIEALVVLPARTFAMVMTVEEFLNSVLPEGKAELVRGELRVTPPSGAPHGTAASNLVILLGVHVKQFGRGRVFADSFGYELVRLPHTVRVPDASFIRADRLPTRRFGGCARVTRSTAEE